MAKVLDTFEFPHGGRKGLDIEFDQWFDGQTYQLERGDDWPETLTAESFLGSLSRAANAKGLRVNKAIPDPDTVVIRVRPKKVKEENGADNGEATATEAAKPARSRSK